MVFFRKSAGPWADFMARLRVGVIGAVAIFGLGVLHVQYMSFREKPWFREAIGTIPFTQVTVTNTVVTEDTITVFGTLIKARDCRTLGAPTAQVVRDGVVFPASFESLEPKSTTDSRPQSPTPQAFGAWVITSSVSWPDEVRLYRTHECGDTVQTNPVFVLPWINYPP